MSRIELLKKKFESQEDPGDVSTLSSNRTITGDKISVGTNGTLPNSFRPIDTSSVRVRRSDSDRVGNKPGGPSKPVVTDWRAALKPTPGSKTLLEDENKPDIKCDTGLPVHTKPGYLGNNHKGGGFSAKRTALKPPSPNKVSLPTKGDRRKLSSEDEPDQRENKTANPIRRSKTATGLITTSVDRITKQDRFTNNNSQKLSKKAILPPSTKSETIKLGLGQNRFNSHSLGKIQPFQRDPLKSDERNAISKDSGDDSRCNLIDDAPTKSSGKAPAMEKWRKLSEGKGIVTRARKESGAPLTNSTKDVRGGGGGMESNGNSAEDMDQDDDEEEEEEECDDEDYEDGDEDGDSSEDTLSVCSDDLDDVFWNEKSEFGFLDDDVQEEEEDYQDEEDGDFQSLGLRDSRRNKPPVPRKPTHLAQKLNNNKQSITSKSKTPTTTATTTTTTGPKVHSKPPLTAAKSTGSSLETRRVNKLSQDQRTYDQVCFEDPSTFSPQPKSKNLERFLGMKPEMAQPIKCIKPIDPLSTGSSAHSNGGTKMFTKMFSRRKSEAGEEINEGDKHYAVVDLHEPDRTTGKGQKDRRGGKNSASSLSPHKLDLQRNSSGQDTSKLSSDSGISMMIDPKRNSSGHLLPGGLKDPLDKSGSMDSDYVEGDSTYSEDSARESDSDPSEEEFELKERPAENITFINQSHKVAYEVLTSERQYVDRLHLLHKVFEQKIRSENSKHNWFPKDVINVIFSNLSTIYEFHNKFLLMQFEDRMKEWEKNPCLGDILVRLSPFLKLYTDYVGNFDNAVKCLNTWMIKTPNFASLLQEIQKKPVCVCLTLQHHMLEPVQRIPRYELLLKEYLKKLPAESSDRKDAERALGLISKAAHHSNDMMQTMDHFAKLVKLNERIDFNGETIIDPSRRLLKEGKITRVAARSGDLLDRYLFLFNDILLCCTQKRQITGSVNYKVKDKIDIDGVKLLDGNTTRFRLERSPKSLEFETNTDEQKEEWMAVLLEAIKEMVRKKESFKTSTTLSEREDDYAIPLGERPPSFVKDDDTTMCMKCGLEFNFKRRRHHCRACGVVVCGKCSSYTAPLPYDDKKPNRVCSKCYHLLKGEEDPVESSRKSFVDINENKSFASYLWYLQPKGSTWTRYWVAATEQDLFALRAPKDVRAALTLPIKLYQAYEVEEKDHMEREYAFKLCEGDNSFIFAADNKETKYNWLLVFHEGLQKVLDPMSNGRTSSTSL